MKELVTIDQLKEYDKKKSEKIVLQSEKGEPNGVVPLDNNKLIPAKYIEKNSSKVEIGVDEIEDDDIGIMTHKPNSTEEGDRKWKFGTLFEWIRGKLEGVFATKESIENLNVNLGELDKSTKSTIVTTNANLLYRGASQLGIEVTDKFQLFKITAFCEDGYNIALAKYKHDASLSLKTISNSGTTITTSNKVGTIVYSGALKCAYVEYIGVADESVNFGSWTDNTEFATMDKVATNVIRQSILVDNITVPAQSTAQVVKDCTLSGYNSLMINAQVWSDTDTLVVTGAYVSSDDKAVFLVKNIGGVDAITTNIVCTVLYAGK